MVRTSRHVNVLNKETYFMTWFQ
uniref:Uncharacterized protein n=1 Tax=Rhizophora mucronata TaxID=61149 RepID=A0A2P2LPG2_RHIMU